MSNIWIGALSSTVIVSIISITGIFFLSLKTARLQKIVLVLVSFAVGALLGNVFFHLLPESFEMIESTTLIAVLVMAGILVFFIMEKFLHWHHGHRVEDVHHNRPKSYGYVSLFADGIHNFTDGILIAAGWMAGPEIGIATTLAVILHEIPQEISDFGILIHAGFTAKKAIWLNFYAALAAVLGTTITLMLGTSVESLATYVLPVAAGGFIYLAGTDLIPELNKDRSRLNSLIQLVMIIAGLLLMYFVMGDHSHAGHVHVHGPDCVHTH
jgi:zinc and cadmium transporter